MGDFRRHDLFLSPKTLKLFQEVKKQADAECKTLIGQELTWRYARNQISGNSYGYEGRKCEVISALWDEYNGEIMIRVKTRNAKGDGFIDDNDSFHRQYRHLTSFEPLTMKQLGNLQVKDKNRGG